MWDVYHICLSLLLYIIVVNTKSIRSPETHLEQQDQFKSDRCRTSYPIITLAGSDRIISTYPVVNGGNMQGDSTVNFGFPIMEGDSHDRKLHKGKSIITLQKQSLVFSQ